jgi:hypothetical protein
MSRETLLTLVFAFFVLLILLMGVGWLTRRRRQRDIASPLPVPDDPGAITSEFSGFYVSTTPEGEPLNRIAVRGLGFRARTTVSIAETGLIVSLPGGDFFIPVADLREASRARYTIDRVVEEGGLALVGWELGDMHLDSYFRVDDTQDFVDAVSGILDANRDLNHGLTPTESEKP